MADAEDDGIPEGISWDPSDKIFRDMDGKSMGGKFFDQWKERRLEFPHSPPRRVTRRPVVDPGLPEPGSRTPDPAEVEDGSVADFLEIAARRKALFDAYIKVGFDRAEALQLCTMD